MPQYITSDEYVKAQRARIKARQYERRRRFLSERLGIKSAEALVTMWMRGEIKVIKCNNDAR